MNNKQDFIENHLEEIVSELARVGRPDLILVLKGLLNYYPDTEEETSEDISTGEEEEFLGVEDLGHGHCQLK